MSIHEVAARNNLIMDETVSNLRSMNPNAKLDTFFKIINTLETASMHPGGVDFVTFLGHNYDPKSFINEIYFYCPRNIHDNQKIFINTLFERAFTHSSRLLSQSFSLPFSLNKYN